MSAVSSVVWQPVRALDLRFAIESDAPKVTKHARALFAPWLTDAADATRCWRIEADGTDAVGNELYSVPDARRDYVPDGEVAPNWQQRPIGELLTQIEYGAIAHLVANLPPQFVGLHGALLSREFDGARRAVIVVGPKEAGKSTLACALWRAGWSLHCDDFTLLDEQGRAHPSARRVSLRSGSRELLGDLWGQAQRTPNARVSSVGMIFHPHEIEGEIPALTEPLEVGAICFLKRRGVEMAPAQTAPLNDVEAAFALLPYSTLLLERGSVEVPTRPADWGAHLGVVAARIAGIPLHDVGRGAPDAMVRVVEALVERVEPEHS